MTTNTKTMTVFGADGIAAALETLKPGQQVLLAGTVVQGRTGIGIRVCIVSTQVAVRSKCPAGATVSVSRSPSVPPAPPAPVRRPPNPQTWRPAKSGSRSNGGGRPPYRGGIRYVPMGE